VTDDEQERIERARRLREEIDRLAKGGGPPRRPRSPRDFIEEKMREGPPGEPAEDAEAPPEDGADAGERG
jgi:hypothetical protein